MEQPLAHVHPNAKIANNVTIEPFVMIHDDVVVEEGCHIASHATLLPGTRLAKNVHIHQGAVIGGTPQDLKFKGEYTTVEIGENSVIREYATINRGTSAKGRTVIGKNCLIMAYAHVAHDCVVGNNVILVNYTGLAGEVEVHDYAILGGATVVHQFCRIGAHAMLSGGSRVSKDVPPYTKAGREPLTYVGVNSIGLRRRGFSNENIHQIQDIYRYIYQKGFNNAQAVEVISEEVSNSEAKETIINFIKNSHRGLIKGYFAE